MKRMKSYFIIPLLFLATSLFAQNRKIVGKIVGKNNEPISGASVAVKGTNVGASANLPCNFFFVRG